MILETLIAGCEPPHLRRVGLWCVWFVLLHILGKFLGRYNRHIKSRPTVVGGTCHGVVTGWLALAVHTGVLDYTWWRTVGIPLSAGYLITDTVFYCFAKRDLPMVVHHMVMLIAHWCVGSVHASTIGGAGDPVWAVKVSAAGYLSELPNPSLNVRWFMTKMLTKHSVFFTINNMYLLITWIGTRLVFMPFLVYTHVVPRYEDYAKVDGIHAYYTCIFFHFVIILMSLHWLVQLLKGGLQPLLVFDPKAVALNPNMRDNVKTE
mmetsp:Transcript_31005/g.70942  ORF Transcript_31005/g.70942 Transcript_31005/m.70942 type:complete len:262 (+) Transcript_31005:20-805(+)